MPKLQHLERQIHENAKPKRSKHNKDPLIISSLERARNNTTTTHIQKSRNIKANWLKNNKLRIKLNNKITHEHLQTILNQWHQINHLDNSYYTTVSLLLDSHSSSPCYEWRELSNMARALLVLILEKQSDLQNAKKIDLGRKFYKTRSLTRELLF